MGRSTFATLDLSRQDFDEYYIGYANRVLWPLFHFRSSLVQFSRRNLAGYLRVNRMFARALAPMLLPQDLVWVHDYHLIPLAEELRKLDRTSRSAFSCIPRFPPPNCCACCRTTSDMVQIAVRLRSGRLSNPIGPRRLSRLSAALGRRRGAGRRRLAGLRTHRACAGLPDRHRRRDGLGAGRGGRRQPAHARACAKAWRPGLMIGVDRLDYSKGLAARFQAYSHLLETYPETRGRTVLIQIAPPSRSEVPEYQRNPQEPRSGRRPHQQPLRRIRLDAAALHQQELQPPDLDRVFPGEPDRAGHAAARRHEPGRQGICRLATGRRSRGSVIVLLCRRGPRARRGGDRQSVRYRRVWPRPSCRGSTCRSASARSAGPR